MITIVVAYGRNHVIGVAGGLPWHLPSDMKHFRKVTAGGTVVMGRHTYDSIPEKFRPLPGRRNLVLSRTPGYEAPGAETFTTLEDAIAAAHGEVFVIGGGQTFIDALPLTERVWATEVDASPEGDTFFPALDSSVWALRENREPVSENDHTFTIRRYERRG